MKRIIFPLSVLLCLNTQAKQQKLSLQKALDLKIVSAKAQSLGGYQDYCMKMHLKSLSKDSLVIIVEAGRRLNSVNDEEQDILIIKEEILTLRNMEDKWIQVRGYCCQSKNHAPAANAKYEINSLADSGLVALAKYLNHSSFDSEVTQQAIWAISDKQPTARITTKNDSVTQQLRQLVANLKGEPLPWYTVISKIYVYESGAMENFPLWLRGKFNYTNDKECYTTLHILNSKGEEVCQIVKQWTKPGTKDLDLNIPVKGLAKGKYTIELKSDEKQLAQRVFEI